MSDSSNRKRLVGGAVVLLVVASVVYFVFLSGDDRNATPSKALPSYGITSIQSFAPGTDAPASVGLRTRGDDAKTSITVNPKHELRMVIAPPDAVEMEGLTLVTYGRKGDGVEALLPQLRPNAAGKFEIRLPGETLYGDGKDKLDLHFVITTTPVPDVEIGKLDYNAARDRVSGIWLTAEVNFNLLN